MQGAAVGGNPKQTTPQWVGDAGRRSQTALLREQSPALHVKDYPKRRNAFADGFLTNLLNPKATVFLLSLFTLFSNAMSTLPMKIAFAASIPLIAMTWFSILSLSITHPSVLPFLQRHQNWVLKVMALILIGIGITWITSSTIQLFGVFL